MEYWRDGGMEKVQIADVGAQHAAPTEINGRRERREQNHRKIARKRVRSEVRKDSPDCP